MWYIPEGYSTRTEFKVLNQLVDTSPVNLSEIPNGILVLPGILLLRIDKIEADRIKAWIKKPSNHLILTPAWTEVDLKQILGLSTELDLIKNEKIIAEDILIDYIIRTKSKKVLSIDGEVVGTHYRENTGTGLITIITLPILDYRLKNEEYRKNWWNWISEIDQLVERKIEVKDGKAWEPGPVQKMIYILKEAGIFIDEDLPGLLKNYFGIRITDEEAEIALSDLERREIIKECQITETGKALFANYNFKSFTKVLQARKKDTDEWDNKK
jgi:hypothetical protein